MNWLEYLVEQNKHERIISERVNVSILLASDILIPKFQRDKVQEHIDEIVKALKTTKEKYGQFEMISVITIGYFKKKFYMIDGQHRYSAIKSLYGLYPEREDGLRPHIVLSDEEDWKLGITIVRCGEFKEMQSAFLTLNKAMPIAEDLRFADNEDEMDHQNDIRDYVKRHMNSFFSKTKDVKRAKRPNFGSEDELVLRFVEKHKPRGVVVNLDFFLEENRRWGEYLKSVARVCWYAFRAVELVQQKVEGRTTRRKDSREVKALTAETNTNKYVKVKNTPQTTTEPLYLGCYYFEDDPVPVEPSKEIRCIVKDLWFDFAENEIGYIPDEEGNVLCIICCKRYVSPESFELGHIHSKSQEGKPHIDNLVPICHTCNRRMSATHMRDYCEMKHLDGWRIITQYLEHVGKIPNVFHMQNETLLNSISSS